MHARSSDFLADLAPRRMLATGMLTLAIHGSVIFNFLNPPPKKESRSWHQVFAGQSVVNLACNRPTLRQWRTWQAGRLPALRLCLLSLENGAE